MQRQRFLAVFGALLMILGTIIPVSAQVGDSYTTPSGQHTVTWNGNWSLESSSSEAGMDLVLLMNLDEFGVMAAAFGPSGKDLATVRDTILEGFAEDGTQVSLIDKGEYDNVAYELDVAEFEGTEMGLFTLVIDRGPGGLHAVMFISPATEFGASMADAQTKITVDGQQIFEGIDPYSLQDQLGNAPAQSSGSNTSGSTSSTTTTNQSNRTSSQSYRDPVYHYTVTYDAPFMDISSEFAFADFALAVESPVTVISFTGMQGVDATPSMMEAVLADTFAESLDGGTYVGSASDDNSVLFVGLAPEGMFIQEFIILNSGDMVSVTALVSGDAAQGVSLLQQSVQVDGEPVFDTWDYVG